MSLSCLAEAMRSQAGSFNLDHGHQPGLCEWIIGINGSMDHGFVVKNWINGFGLYGYGSILIHTIFRGMNIHKSQLFWCSPGYQGFDPLPYDYVPPKTWCTWHWSIGHAVSCSLNFASRPWQGTASEKSFGQNAAIRFLADHGTGSLFWCSAGVG